MYRTSLYALKLSHSSGHTAVDMIFLKDAFAFLEELWQHGVFFTRHFTPNFNFGRKFAITPERHILQIIRKQAIISKVGFCIDDKSFLIKEESNTSCCFIFEETEGQAMLMKFFRLIGLRMRLFDFYGM